MEFKGSQTMFNLMRAFAGESQARNRYTFAASAAKKEQLAVVEQVFLYTAGQEKEHAELFYNRLVTAGAPNIEITAGYPVDFPGDVLSLLRLAHRNKYEEFHPVYADFARAAEAEGFSDIAATFRNIAAIEQTHGDRFGLLADQLEAGTLFRSETENDWVCHNCGYVHRGTEAPGICPVCYHDRGYYARLDFAPWGMR